MIRVCPTDAGGDSLMVKTTPKARNVFFVLLGVAALVLKRHYSGPFMEIIHSYSGNVSASFAVYFVVGISTSGWRYGKLVTASIALLVVELFEVTNGFGIMTNVYDSVDFAANAVGLLLALVLDTLAGLRWRNELDRGSQ
jgi:hypothetical protein